MRYLTRATTVGLVLFATSAGEGRGDELSPEVHRAIAQEKLITCGGYVLRIHSAKGGKLKDLSALYQGYVVPSKKLEWVFVYVPEASYNVDNGLLVIAFTDGHILWPDGSKSTSLGARYELKLREIEKAVSPTMPEMHLFMQMEEKLKKQ